MAFSLKRAGSKLTSKDYAIALKYGLWTGFLFCVCSIVLYLLHHQQGQLHTWGHDGILLVMMIAACLHYRRNKDNLPIRKAFLLCFCVGIIASAIFLVWIVCYATLIQPDTVMMYINHQQQLIEQTTLSDIEKHQQTVVLYQATPWLLAVKTALEIGLIATFGGLFISIFCKYERPNNKT